MAALTGLASAHATAWRDPESANVVVSFGTIDHRVTLAGQTADVRTLLTDAVAQLAAIEAQG